MHRSVTLITAPSNLGLRPLRPEHVPGTWRAPEALIGAGLEDILRPHSTINLPRPTYNALPQSNTRLLNGPAIRDFNLTLANAVSEVFASQRLAFVLGGDCSILLGALAGLRRHSPISLVHIDGHSDFRYPGNYDPERVLGTVAGMDLALATGRGEALLTSWPNIEPPLVPDIQVVQIGERESRNSDFQWPDVNDTEINRIDVFAATELGAAGVLRRTYSTLDRVNWPFWIHLDVDVLDQELMPAVDSPGSPGIAPDALTTILSKLMADSRAAGVTLTIYDLDLDPDGRHARSITGIIAATFGKHA